MSSTKGDPEVPPGVSGTDPEIPPGDAESSRSADIKPPTLTESETADTEGDPPPPGGGE